MIRFTSLLLVLGLSLAAAPVRAQEVHPLVKFGKWVLAAGALGMNYMAARAHDRADEQFDALEARCLDNHALCTLETGGSYTDPTSETLFQESRRYDRQARRWLFGGETALLGAAAMFVWELTRSTPKPDHIPFVPEVRELIGGTGVGVRVNW
jgi:hypothetical protein